MDSSRYGPNGPSAIKIYHYLTYKLHKSTQKARTKLTEAMSDASSAGRWQPVKKPGQLEAEVEALDHAADEIRIMTGGFDAEAAGVWRSALDRLISSLESSTEYFAEFGFHIMTFKKEHPIFTGGQLREAIDEPMGILATNYRLQKTETRQRGRRHPGSWNRWNKNNGSAMAAYQTDDMCFEFRESGKCSRGDKCFAKHDGRTGNACTNSEYLKTGVCSEFKQCKNVHIWDTKKFGTKEAFLEKQQNKMLKAAVGHYPAMVMRRVPDTRKESDDGSCDEQPVEIGKHISLCDGMACGAMAMEDVGIAHNGYYAYEKNQTAKKIAKHAYPAIDHSLGDDVMDITEQTVRDWGPVSSMFIGAPCNDLTNLRNFIDGVFVPEPDKRPGLDGPSGMILRHCLQVLKWALHYNPKMMFVMENVVFDDRKEDWTEVCDATGVEPVVIMGSDVSHTRRLRAWWTNIKLPASYTELTKDQSRGDPNDCMDPGRKIMTFEVDGRQQSRPIGASWTGDPDEPTAKTGRPIEVIEDGKPGVQQLRPGEAEKLHNLRAGCTDAPGVRTIDRLTAIGGGWDMNVIRMILQHSNLKVSEVAHMNGAMQACPGEAGLQEYMKYSAENTTQACPTTDV